MFVIESQMSNPAVLGSQTCPYALFRSDDMLGKKGFTTSLLSPCTAADQNLWSQTVQSCLIAQRADAGIRLSRLLLLDIWHACGPCMAVIPTSALSCLHTCFQLWSHVLIPPVALCRQINHCYDSCGTLKFAPSQEKYSCLLMLLIVQSTVC